jgi:hydrogenase nickel incorporation protein HypB
MNNCNFAIILKMKIMCDTCGCEGDNKITYNKPGEELHNHDSSHNHNHTHQYAHHHNHEHGDGKHEHDHIHEYSHLHEHNDHEHHHDHENEHEHREHVHDHYPQHGREIKIEQDLLQKNNSLAERNRGYFDAKNLFALNVVSSPGSGKTSLLERTIKEMGKELNFYVIEGDQQTMNDANRIAALKVPVIQINTGNGCHLDAEMVNTATRKLNPENDAVLFIENVGNLVCPSLFDLGEKKRVVVISVTEGDDKPIKYPTMFHSADICIINKTDLLPYVDFSVEKAKNYALQVNHHLTFFEVSVKTGEGMDKWYEWLKENK